MPENTSTLIEISLREDVGGGDVTSRYFVSDKSQARALLVAREEGVLAGVDIAAEVFKRLDSSLHVEQLLSDGDGVAAGAIVLEVSGLARSILTAERTALNFIQRLSGIATQTRRYAGKIKHTQARLLDTRKTTPGWRKLEKDAVRAGGGTNHRMGLFDRALVKDNHLTTHGDIALLQSAIHRLKADRPEIEVELECDTLEQVKAFLKLEGVDYLLLDNMSADQLRQAVEIRGELPILLEASGGITLENIASVAETQVDFISVGALTHSAPSLDFGLDFVS